MKKFKDLKVGDSIFAGFEKKDIVYIKPSRYLEDDIKIHTSDGGVYNVPYYVTSYSDFSISVHGEQVSISSDKEAVVQFYKDQIRDLQIEFDDNIAHLEKMLEKAKQLED